MYGYEAGLGDGRQGPLENSFAGDWVRATLQLHASTPNYSLDLEFDCVSTISWPEWALCGRAADLFAFI